MKLYRSLEALPASLRGGALSIGNFDGVHMGHARLIERLRAQARQVGGPAVVFTFDPHPAALLRPELAPPPLTWLERKAELLHALGVDAVVAYPTDRRLLALSAEDFFRHVIVHAHAAQALVEGPNFFFGKDRTGDIDTLRRLCHEAEMTLEIVEPLLLGEEYVSSSRIRRLISAGGIAEANGMLTRPYRVRGLVTHGAARGAGLGFPTANLERIETLLPCPGVYAGAARLEQKTWPAAINLGPNPTFGEGSPKFEAHLLGYDGDLYGRWLEVDFLTRLRDIQRFPTIDAFRGQLDRDLLETRRAFDSHRHPSSP